MSTTVVGHRPTSHRPFRNLVQVGYSSPRNAAQVETTAPHEEALLAISMNSGIAGVNCTKPFFLPPRNANDGTHGAVEKGLGYGAFGVVWSVIDPRDGQRVALKRIPRVFHNPITAKRVHRELRMLSCLKHDNVCDFGLARMDDPYGEAHLTQEVVTQYYRSPELLMEATRYSYAVDIWSVGCTFAELLGRRILFPARSPLEQLELILNLTGSPSPDDLDNCHPDACCFVLSSRPRHANTSMLYALTPDVNDMTVHLLGSMLKFNPRQRISAADALNHPFLEEARLRYHSCMCSCCHDVSPSLSPGHEADPTNGFCCAPSPSGSSCASSTPSSDSTPSTPGKLVNRYETKTAANAMSSACSTSSGSSSVARRRYCHDLDPICSVLLPLDLDSGFRRLSDAKRVLWDSIQDYHRRDDRLARVVLNRNGVNYHTFIK
ncbi:nemo like kinase [Paragonimus westermani]|uniref:Nemo like kinase n=1 Tax=Paragonimus westermani TaxID=34504 RepID=A0A5J4NPP5_9TREM|nr:nemo like kinase [Paragonimus westermani]